MIIKPTKLNKKEQVGRDELCYEWVAYYNDGTILKQYDEKKKLVYHFGHIDQDKIYEFELVPKKDNLSSIKINLETGLFYINNKSFTELYQGKDKVPLTTLLSDKKVTSSWGNKAKLLYIRHMKRDFVPDENGFNMKVSAIYEIGWEAEVDGNHKKHILMINEQGQLSIPPTFEEQGFKLL
jgi:hypothetical protein